MASGKELANNFPTKINSISLGSKIGYTSHNPSKSTIDDFTVTTSFAAKNVIFFLSTESSDSNCWITKSFSYFIAGGYINNTASGLLLGVDSSDFIFYPITDSLTFTFSSTSIRFRTDHRFIW